MVLEAYYYRKEAGIIDTAKRQTKKFIEFLKTPTGKTIALATGGVLAGAGGLLLFKHFQTRNAGGGGGFSLSNVPIIGRLFGGGKAEKETNIMLRLMQADPNFAKAIEHYLQARSHKTILETMAAKGYKPAPAWKFWATKEEKGLRETQKLYERHVRAAKDYLLKSLMS